MHPLPFLLFVVDVLYVHGLDNGLAVTPPMGWCTWARFGCGNDCHKDPKNCIREELIIEQAHRLIDEGYRDAGYVYVNIDDCWQSLDRDKAGRLQPDPTRFPHGIKWLADYMHERGLKLGIYTDYGDCTCAGYPSTPWDKQEIDAKTFAEWGIDSLKVDGCYGDPKTMNDAYPRFGKFLNETGRPILYSCSWPFYRRTADPPLDVDYKAVAKSCNMWRVVHDIYAIWGVVRDIIWKMGLMQSSLQAVAGPGAWNDPDQLVIGAGLTAIEAQTTMAMWAIFSAPLLMSNDLRNMTDAHRKILINRDVIAVNQDKLGIQGTKIVEYKADGSITRCKTARDCSTSALRAGSEPQAVSEAWARPLEGGDIAVVLYNPADHDKAVDIVLDLADVFAFWAIQSDSPTATMRDLFSGEQSTATDRIHAKSVPGHGCRMLRLSPTTAPISPVQLYSV